MLLRTEHMHVGPPGAMAQPRNTEILATTARIVHQCANFQGIGGTQTLHSIDSDFGQIQERWRQASARKGQA